MDFFDALVRYEVALWNAVDAALADAGEVELSHLHALRIIERHDAQARVQDLSDAIGITAGAASKFTDRLERDGLVVRRPNPADRRSSLLTLSPAGGSALASAEKVCRTTVMAALGGEDVDTLTAALTRLTARLLDTQEAAA